MLILPRIFVAAFAAFALLPCIAVASELQVGVASAEITPIQGVDRMSGMGFGEAVPVEKIHDPLFAKVIVFQNGENTVALLSLDLILFAPENINRIRQGVTDTLGIESVMVSLTHTHGSGIPDDAVSEKIIQSCLDITRTAFENLTPARVGSGSGEVDESYNRRVIKEDGSVEMLWNNSDRLPTAPVDNEVGVLCVRNAESDAVIATLVNYTAHPVISMNFEELIISADYPGIMAQQVESNLGGLCLFFLGASGDINAYDADIFRQVEADEAFAAVERLGTVMAESVQSVVSGINNYGASLELDFDATILTMALREHGHHAEKDQEVEVDSLLLGQRFALVTIPGEFFVELGMEIKRRSPAEATFILTNTNGYFRYIPTIQAACEGGYGASSGTLLELGAGDKMVDAALISLRYQMDQVKPLE